MSYRLYTSRINKVRFNVIGTEDIKEASNVPVVSHDLFRGNMPYPGGVYDGHLGTTDHSYKCLTCHNNKKNCLGHPGHLQLNYPVFSPMLINEVRKWLKLICFKCGNCVLSKSDYSQYPKASRLYLASKVARAVNRKCANCGELHPVVTKDREEKFAFYAELYEDKKITNTYRLFPHTIKQILDRVSNATVIELGKSPESHPRNFVLYAIKVPPTTIRPDVRKMGGGRSTNDDLTVLLKNIIKKNETLPTVIPDEIDQKLEKSIYELNSLYYNFVRGSSGKRPVSGITGPTHSLALRLRGKQGRFRKTQMGKRVQFSGRATIVGDPTLKLTEMGMPLKHAKTLQVEETVQQFNKERLMLYFLNGTKKYPGCTKVIKRDSGAEYGIDNLRENFELEIGDKLLRDIVTGDVIMFNRQPSLKPSNISAVKIVVSEDPEILVYRMNVLLCPLYDADFDGDQMNTFCNSAIIARNEIAEMAGIPNFFINHSNSSPLIGELDDSIIGTFELTRATTKFDKYHAMLLFSNCTYLPTFTDYSAMPTVDVSRGGKKMPTKYYTGRDIITKVLEETPVNFTRDPTWYKSEYSKFINYDPSEIKVVIDRGRHVSGVLDKSSIGKGQTGNLFHVIGNEYGNERALEVMYNVQHLAINYVLQSGYSIGIMDMLVSDESLKQIHEIESGIIKQSDLITEKLNMGQIVPPIDKTVGEFYEEMQIAKLKVMDDFMEPILKSINPNTNALFKLVQSGSKGSISNIFHMNSCIGQILINGERIRERFSYKRTLAYFPRFDKSPESRGYITNSYMSGMTSPELVFNSMNARFDFISKALSTSITGEQNRKSIKTLESIITNNHRMCVKGRMLIQQFYGEDGLDARKIVKVKFPTVMLSDDALKTGYHYQSKDAKLQATFDEEFSRIKADRDEYRTLFLKMENSTVNELMTDTRFMPVDPKTILNDIIHEHQDAVKAKPADDAELAAMTSDVATMTENLPYLLTNEEYQRNKGEIPDYMRAGVYLLGVLIRSTLCSMQIKRANRQLLTMVLDKIKIVYGNALVDYGTAVGIIAAQSFSAPLTQYMLDAHHRSVSGGTSKSGVTKAKEVLGAKPTAKLEAPSMLISLLPEFHSNKAKAQELANNIEMMNFRQFVVLAQVFFEKYGEPIHPKYISERAMITEFQKYNPLLTPPADLNKWCVRFVLNKTAMILKNMNLELIVNKLRETYPDTFIVYTPENSRQIIMRVYIKSTMFRTVEQKDIEGLKNSMLDTTIRGVAGIKIATVTKMIRHKVNGDGSIVRDTDRWGVTTLGTNLVGVMQMNGVDAYTCQTDAIEETSRVLGIEAARQRIITEIRNIGVSDVSYRHLSIYADEMTYNGRVTSIERGGLSTREANNIMLRVGFSAPLQTLEEAGINAMENAIYGLTANLLVGATPQIGTNYNQYYVNEQFVKQNTVSADKYLDEL